MTKPTDSRDFYDREAVFASRYSTQNYWESRYHNKRMAILKALLRNSFVGCKTFLDVGCGTGEYLSFAWRSMEYVCGLDISKRYLYRCKSSKTNDLVLGNSENLPFQNQVFDCLLCSEVIEHIRSQKAAIHEILRVSRKSVLLSTPNHGVLRTIMGRFNSQKLASIDLEFGHINIIRFPELIQKLKNYGWRISLAFTVHIFPPYLDVIQLPPTVAPLIDLLERILDRLLPKRGSVAIVCLEATS